ncbi:hypothetical protein QYE76_049658 [Lolium multiflorum]|uniref:FBD domain-containing protein n=1 Tax=Lolium multiflorum TaxID=4521 RepID=A0AAD8SPQ5_LOLMU|nr:hypothetical protein QYE76_049658 [Lolium multiflorum]
MELRSGRRLRRSSPPPPPPHGTRSQRMDRISALPDEMLLLVLARLRCIRTAAQTSLLSRRWRGLWIGLWTSPTDLTFRGLAPATIETLFGRFATASPQVSTLDISLSQGCHGTRGAANSLLRAAMQLSPEHLIFTLQEPCSGYVGYIELPCFERTTSIDIKAHHIWLQQPLPAGKFTALESLSVTGQIYDLGPLLIRCPRLRELSLTYPDKYALLIPHEHGEFPALEKLSLSGKMVNPGSLLGSSKSLRELSVTQLDTCPLRIMLPPSGEFPMLEKLTLSGNIAELGILLNGCPRLHVLSVTLRGMRIHSLKAALATIQKAVPLGLFLSTLGVEIPWRDDISAARFAYLLRTMERLSPQELVVTANLEGCYASEHFQEIKANLPCFAHATSIEMNLQNVCFKSLKPGEFCRLERLSLPRLCNTIDIGTLVTRCPRLRVLKVTLSTGKMTVHSASLQILDVNWNSNTECHGIDIVTPVLKQLHVKVRAEWDVSVSLSASMLENLSWQCWYMSALVFGSWCLESFGIQTMENVMCLHLNANANSQLDAELNFAQEVEKLPCFSTLEINFEADWHVYGALVLQLLRMRRIRVATKRLEVNLPWWPEAKQACPQNCHCDKPKNWRRQSNFCTSLEEVEIRGFNGEDHEHDFLRLILKCSPMLKSVIVQASEVFRGHATELSNIYMAHPFVKFFK